MSKMHVLRLCNSYCIGVYGTYEISKPGANMTAALMTVCSCHVCSSINSRLLCNNCYIILRKTCILLTINSRLLCTL